MAKIEEMKNKKRRVNRSGDAKNRWFPFRLKIVTGLSGHVRFQIDITISKDGNGDD